MFPNIESLVGQTIDGMVLTRVIGIGGTGTVFLGHPVDKPEALIAMKVLTPPPQLSLTERAEFSKRFAREARFLQQLQHPHILTVQSVGEEPTRGITYMIMPYIAGGTLASRLAAGPLSLVEIDNYVSQVADALDYAHSQNIVHRDIKPANVLIDSQDQIYLADFGIAKLFDLTSTTLTTQGQIIGTPEYMAPEQAEGSANVTPAADIYSLGMLTYNLVTGKLPFQATSLMQKLLQIMQAPPAPPRANRPDLPEPGQAVILQALNKDPKQRFATAGAFAQAFSQGIQGQWAESIKTLEVVPDAVTIKESPVLAATLDMSMPLNVIAPQTTIKQRNRSMLIGSLAAVLIVALLGTVIFAFGRSHSSENGSASVGQNTFASQPPIPTSTTIPSVTGAATATMVATATSTTTTTSPVATTPSGQSPPVNIPTFASRYQVNVRYNQVNLAIQQETTITVSCLSGEQMLSGGHYISDNGNPAYESYPSGANSWTATARSGYANTTFSVYAVCLSANFSAGIQIAQFQTTLGTSAYTCPSGSVLTGGGFRYYAAIATPAGNSWQGKPSFGSSVGAGFALCATKNVQVGSQPTQAFAIAPKSSNQITLQCPGGETLTGGGFAYDNDTPDVYENAPGKGASSWFVGAYDYDAANSQTATGRVICIQIPSQVR